MSGGSSMVVFGRSSTVSLLSSTGEFGAVETLRRFIWKLFSATRFCLQTSLLCFSSASWSFVFQSQTIQMYPGRASGSSSSSMVSIPSALYSESGFSTSLLVSFDGGSSFGGSSCGGGAGSFVDSPGCFGDVWVVFLLLGFGLSFLFLRFQSS